MVRGFPGAVQLRKVVGPGPSRHRRFENALRTPQGSTTLARRDCFERVRNIGEGEEKEKLMEKGWWHEWYGCRNGGGGGC